MLHLARLNTLPSYVHRICSNAVKNTVVANDAAKPQSEQLDGQRPWEASEKEASSHAPRADHGPLLRVSLSEWKGEHHRTDESRDHFETKIDKKPSVFVLKTNMDSGQSPSAVQKVSVTLPALMRSSSGNSRGHFS